MQVESFHLSPIEKELHFIRWRQQNGVKIILIDLDDTICDTQPVFSKHISEAVKHLSKNSLVPDKNIWETEIRSINDILFEQHGVNPNNWNLVVDIIEEKYRLHSKVSVQTKEIFQRIYTTPLQFKPGAREGLDFLKKTDTPIAIPTHANKNWTWRKYNDWLKLNRYLDWDDVFIVNENGHKTAQSWQDTVDYVRLKANQCAMSGDSPRSDINPSWNIGIKHCFLIQNPTSWSVHQQPVPPETIIINNLSEIANVGYQHLLDLKPRKTIS